MADRLPAGSPGLLRRLNSTAVLRAIRTGGPISRTELARVTGLSKPTVNDVTESLLGTGYVSESLPDGDLPPRRRGPKARMLRFQSDLGYVIGIDIGANKILAIVTDLDGHVIASERQRTPHDPAAAEQLVTRVNAIAEVAMEAGGVSRANVKAIGVGTPGVVDPVAGTVTLAPQLPGWEGVALQGMLSRHFACEILVDNEVHLSLLAEQWLGAAHDIDDALYVQIGVGIGGGILIGGKVYRGAGGAAGEIGYLPLFDSEPDGEHLGPFEHAAGGSAFARLGRECARRQPESPLHQLAGGDLDAIDAEMVFAAAAAGDSAVAISLDELLGRLARGIAAAVVVLNPATVILGGGISRAGERLLAPLAREIPALVPVPPRITLSTLGDEAVALGGARMALNAVEDRLYDITPGATA
jgi:predicted NBD/HSP70 family sugar kinase